MRYLVVFILFAVAMYSSTVAAALLIGRDSVATIFFSLLIGAIAGTLIIVIGLKGKLR
jgi:hypothetical protein